MFQTVGLRCFTKGNLVKAVKRIFALGALLIVLALVGVILVGWTLVRPVQKRVGDPPPDLNAHTVYFKSDSEPRSLDGGAQLNTIVGPYCFCPA